MANGFNSQWIAILRKHQARVPAGSAWRRWQQAAKDASAEYHGRRGSRRRSNPAPEWVKWALIGGSAVLVYSWWQGKTGQEARQLLTSPRSAMSPGTGL